VFLVLPLTKPGVLVPQTAFAILDTPRAAAHNRPGMSSTSGRKRVWCRSVSPDVREEPFGRVSRKLPACGARPPPPFGSTSWQA
jgi:hypothetical protein